MLFARESGILMHPTSFPGPWGLGTLGTEAEDFVQWLSGTGATVWQLLPLSPPVCAHSPYQSLSSFALNPLLLSPGKLMSAGYLTKAETGEQTSDSLSRVNWKTLASRQKLLEKAAERALASRPPDFEAFCSQRWVQEWGRFSARKEMNAGRPWHLWKNLSPPPRERVLVHSMIQFLIEGQWKDLKAACASKGIRTMGDLPIYAAHDSSDVFYNRGIFKLLRSGEPEFVAGVPPDYFSSTGQMWGNPVYQWAKSAETGHRWWTCRLRRALELFDTVRIDHFRGFESYWEIPAGSPDAAEGRWREGPGFPFFAGMVKELGTLPLVAEDLGIITPRVHDLRNRCGFPGMTVLQFALQDPGFSLDSIAAKSVVYTGTHDNDTTAGWLKTTGAALGFGSVKEIVDIALSSPAELAVIPVQDLLGLGSGSRMNTPATNGGNWAFRLNRPYPETDLHRHRSPTPGLDRRS